MDAIPTIQKTLIDETPKITVPHIREKYEFLSKLSQIPRDSDLWDDLLKMDLDLILGKIMRDLEESEPHDSD